MLSYIWGIFSSFSFFSFFVPPTSYFHSLFPLLLAVSPLTRCFPSHLLFPLSLAVSPLAPCFPSCFLFPLSLPVFPLAPYFPSHSLYLCVCFFRYPNWSSENGCLCPCLFCLSVTKTYSSVTLFCLCFVYVCLSCVSVLLVYVMLIYTVSSPYPQFQ